MGNTVSIDPRHLRIWNNLNAIQSDQSRIQMLDTLFAAQEYVNAAKRAGIYAMVLQWMAAVKRGEFAMWPGHQALSQPSGNRQQDPRFATQTQDPRFAASQQSDLRYLAAQQQDPRYPTMNPPRKIIKENNELANVPPPKRALDTLHDSYRVLGIDDTKPLTHEVLKSAYRKASVKAHPDRGGSPEAFDTVTRAFLYLEEVLNKLIPRTATDGNDARFTAPVTKEAAMKAREGLFPSEKRTGGSTSGLPEIEDRPRAPEKPPVSLNPKNLNMTVFNQLFEENRLPDPQNDGYGDWLKSNGQDARTQSHDALRGKFNADVFNKVFAEQSGQANQLAKYTSPDAVTLTGGTELGAGRPAQFTAPMGSRTKYTDLKYAYGEGSTFSQEVAGVKTETRNFDQIKRERESAPVALSQEEMAAIQSIEHQRKLAEQERQRRVAAHDVDAENVYTRMQRRLMIQ